MLTLLRFFLAWKSRKRLIQKKLKKLTFPPREKLSPCSDDLRVASAQLEVFRARGVEEFIGWLYKPLFEAREKGYHLLLYPEYVTLPLLGFLPLAGDENKEKNKDTEINPGEIFRFTAPYFEKIYYQVFSYLAAASGMYIGAGSFLKINQNSLFNTGYLFSPQGKILIEQKKLNLMPQEVEWGVRVGDDLKVAEIEGGWKVAMPVCMDATYFETFRLARNKGADLILLPIADINPEYSEHMALRGIWSRVQETPVFGAKSALVGSFLGYQFTGKSGLYGPGNLTLETENPYKADLVGRSLNRERLKEFSPQRISRVLEEKYDANVYEKIRKKPKKGNNKK